MSPRFTQQLLCLACILSSWQFAAAEDKKPTRTEKKGVRYDPVVKKIEGWTVHVDPAMLAGEHQKQGDRALRMLGAHLHRISILMSDDHL